MVVGIRSAAEATEKALSFVKKYRNYSRPIGATREGAYWMVEIDVGAFINQIAKIKVDAITGDIVEYHIPA